MSTVIAVINRSKRVSNRDVKHMTKACDRQIRLHVAPEWDCLPWKVMDFPATARLPKDCIPIVIFDRASDPEADGFHAEDEQGLRYGRVFVNPILNSGGSVFGEGNSVSVTLSHEVIEAFVDPDINLWAEDEDGVLWAYEACDPVEEDSYRIKMAGGSVYVSNFVLRQWFDSEHRNVERFDHMGNVKRPFQILKEGYATYWDGKKEKIKYGARYPSWRKPGKAHFLARTSRRGVSFGGARRPRESTFAVGAPD